jgi:mono/diheme cytochrome c family protein
MLGWLCLLGANVSAGAAFAADAKELFVAGKCARCHSVESQGIAATPREGEEEDVLDLSKAGAERTADWIEKLLREGKATGVGKHPKYRGSAADLETLAAWLASLK